MSSEFREQIQHFINLSPISCALGLFFHPRCAPVPYPYRLANDSPVDPSSEMGKPSRGFIRVEGKQNVTSVRSICFEGRKDEIKGGIILWPYCLVIQMGVLVETDCQRNCRKSIDDTLARRSWANVVLARWSRSSRAKLDRVLIYLEQVHTNYFSFGIKRQRGKSMNHQCFYCQSFSHGFLQNL